jgi:hypothetical protein
VLIYRDFSAPAAELDFPELGITIEPEKVTTRFIKSAMCVLKARVKISEKSVKRWATTPCGSTRSLASWRC